MPSIEHTRFENAVDLLAALEPTSAFWAPDPSRWMFRGHADAAWKLLPTINRRQHLRSFIIESEAEQLPGDETYCEPTVGQARALLRRFADRLDTSGRPVPGGDTVRQAFDTRIRSPFGGLWLHGLSAEALEELTALGQHNGLPTRLLDWTLVGNYAAYFAASDAANLTNPKSPDIDVWALHRSIDSRTGQIAGDWAHVRVVRPPRAGNPNLHAQSGLFTVSHLPIDDRYDDPRLPRVTVDEIVSAAARAQALPDPVMYRFSLPRAQAGELLRWLRYQRISGESMFPGFDGVVRSVRDAARWGME